MDVSLHSAKKRRSVPAAFRHLGKQIRRHPYLYLMVLPAIVWFLIFCYAPMGGVVMAFQDFRPTRGFFRSKWAGWKHFELLFKDKIFWRAFENTLIISALKLLFGFTSPIVLAFLLNEIFNTKFKRVAQTILYLPHFLSWVIVAGILANLLGSDGVVNTILNRMGIDSINFMANPKNFRELLIITHVLKGLGWGSIIFIAAISGIDPTYYEAAIIDGAGRFRQAIYITLPLLMPTIIIMFILNIGSLVNAGFDQVFALYNSSVLSVGDIIDTYVYRAGLEEARHSFSAAAGLFKSVISMVLVVSTNAASRRITGESLF